MSALVTRAEADEAPDWRVELAAIEARLSQLRAIAEADAPRGPAMLGRPWVMEIASVVVQEYGIPLEELLGGSRIRDITRPRFVWVWLVRTAAGYSFPLTGRLTGYGDHTTVMHACKRVEQWRASDSNFRLITDQLLAIAQYGRQVAHAQAQKRKALMAEEMQAAEAEARP